MPAVGPQAPNSKLKIGTEFQFSTFSKTLAQKAQKRRRRRCCCHRRHHLRLYHLSKPFLMPFAARRFRLMSAAASASASAAPKSSSFAMAQEVFEEGGFDAVLEMLSSRTSVMQATPPPSLLSLLPPCPLTPLSVSSHTATEASRAALMEAVRERRGRP